METTPRRLLKSWYTQSTTVFIHSLSPTILTALFKNLSMIRVCVCVCVQVQSEFILESERESFIEQVREVIENADEKGLERDTNSQVNKTLKL